MWEEPEFKILKDCEVQLEEPIRMCPHCHSKHQVIRQRSDGSPYYVTVFICPRVVVATNEGGCNTTGVCLDCILDAAKELKEIKGG